MTNDITKAPISFRIGTTLYLPDARFDELMALIEEHRGVTDEVTVFTSETHPPLPMETIRSRLEVLARRMSAVRKLGYRTGINILATIGHHEENLPNSLAGDFTPMTDIEGNVCRGSFCPNDERFREYIRELYRLTVAAGPDYIWIDDDVRLYGHMPIVPGCFCDTCLAMYEQMCGTRYTRPSLKAAFTAGSADDRYRARTSWLAFNRRTLRRLFELIESTVHALKPGMPLGFMTGDRFFEGYDIDTWAQVLAGPKGAEVMWRPGGGFYNDDRLGELVEKAHAIGRQVALLPESVVSIQSEIENFPYQRLKKAACVVALEAAAHQAAGCTGVAFNVLSMYDEPLDEYRPLVAALRDARPFYDLLARTFGRSKPQGLWAAWNKDSFVAAGLDVADWLRPDWAVMVGSAGEIHQNGIPAAYGMEGGQVTALTGNAPRAFSDADLKTILSRGVYLDGPALSCLNAMGYGQYTGFTVETMYDKDCIEELLAHPLNEPFVSRRRDNRQSFLWWNVPAAALVPTAAAARPISRLIDYTGKEVAPCGSGVFENALGGRVCAAGYFPWTFLQNLSKASQIKTVFRWLSKDTLPAYVASYHKINLWVREPKRESLAAALNNASMDPAENVELQLRTNKDRITVYDMACNATVVKAADVDTPYTRFVLPGIGPWQMRLVIC